MLNNDTLAWSSGREGHHKIATRSIIGQQKYGTTLAENELPLVDWLNHLQEELMDAINYIERIKQEVKTKDSSL